MIQGRKVYLVDTSAWIESIRSRGDKALGGQIRTLNQAGQTAWCGMVRLELWNGARGSQEINFLRQLESSIIDLPIVPRVWALAEKLARHARATGKTFPATDLLIAACAIFHGAQMIHRDRHFDAILGFSITE